MPCISRTPDIENLLVDSVAICQDHRYFAPVKPYKVYLEGNSDADIDVALMKKIADRFRSMGFKISGSMVAVGRHGPSVLQ